MRWDLGELSGYRLHGRDGSLGTVTDVYFDDHHWLVRYLAVTGNARQPGPRQFLLAPEVISSTDRELGLISVFLRTAAVHDSPAITIKKHVTREDEAKLCEYYGWPRYWDTRAASEQKTPARSPGGPRLCSLEDVLGYRVLAGGEDIGALLDMIIDDHTWKIHCIEVDASGWLAAGRIWVRSDCIRQICGAKQEIALSIPRSAVLSSPKPDLQMLCSPEWDAAPAATAHLQQPVAAL